MYLFVHSKKMNELTWNNLNKTKAHFLWSYSSHDQEINLITLQGQLLPESGKNKYHLPVAQKKKVTGWQDSPWLEVSEPSGDVYWPVEWHFSIPQHHLYKAIVILCLVRDEFMIAYVQPQLPYSSNALLQKTTCPQNNNKRNLTINKLLLTNPFLCGYCSYNVL